MFIVNHVNKRKLDLCPLSVLFYFNAETGLKLLAVHISLHQSVKIDANKVIDNVIKYQLTSFHLHMAAGRTVIDVQGRELNVEMSKINTH